MTTYIIRRLLLVVIVIFIVTLIVFFVIRLLPGDPLIIFLGQQNQQGGISMEELEFLRESYGLNDPIMVQYGNWMWGILQGDLGTSIYYHEDVGVLMADRFPITLHLGILALVFSNALGITLGILAAVRRGKWIDTVVTVLAYIGVTAPVFWVAILLIYTFGLNLQWLPIAGYTSPIDNFWLSTKQVIMPVICLGFAGLAGSARVMRSSMLEIVQQDYIRTAWSKGLRERAVIFKHALKNSLIPMVTLAGIGVGIIFGGAVIVETIFAIPGIGRLLITSIFAQDYVVIQSGTLVIALIIILVNLAVDISYGWLDPRIRYG
ncbi:Dipeptide transport system permease protein DppB [subsurface metagenome]